MNLLIADSFSDSLAKLTNQEQAVVKQAAFDLHVNPANPGFALHRVERARDKDFWTARVNRDVRIVVHKRGGTMLLAYVGHHDDAYAWAERRRLETHPKTGAAQMVEIRERVEEVVIRSFVADTAPVPGLLADETDETLLSCGVPQDWFQDVRAAPDQNALLNVALHLPAEAAEAILNLATGIRPELADAPPPDVVADPFAHPDAQRRFRLLVDEEELRRALDAPWEKWTVFLHPAQREFVTRDFNGPARVTGSAGTGKTVVALHRAVRLARENASARVLLTTFNEVLASSLKTKLERLTGGDQDLAERIKISDLGSLARRLHERRAGPVDLASAQQIQAALSAASAESGLGVSGRFLEDEWKLIVDARNIHTPEAYCDADRRGRRIRVREDQREELWRAFELARAALAAKGVKTEAQMFFDLAEQISTSGDRLFDFCVVDEAQDISEAELCFLAAIAGDKPNGLFFAGDIGQRIFRPRFAWNAYGVEIRGRSRTLRVNYRTSHQIRSVCDVLLPPRLTELDGGEEDRSGVTSVFEGPEPQLRVFNDADEEREAVSAWLTKLTEINFLPHEMALVVRTIEQFNRAKAAADDAGLDLRQLTGTVAPADGKLNMATMHVAKGLEFRAVAVMACDDEIVPFAPRIESARDETDLEEIFATERHLLYVASTRAREQLLITAVDPASEFLEDLTRRR